MFIKLYIEDQKTIRKFEVGTDEDYSSFVSKIKEYGIDITQYESLYEDDEGDKVFFSSDSEFSAIKHQTGDGVRKIKLVKKVDTTKPKVQSRFIKKWILLTICLIGFSFISHLLLTLLIGLEQPNHNHSLSHENDINLQHITRAKQIFNEQRAQLAQQRLSQEVFLQQQQNEEIRQFRHKLEQIHQEKCRRRQEEQQRIARLQQEQIARHNEQHISNMIRQKLVQARVEQEKKEHQDRLIRAREEQLARERLLEAKRLEEQKRVEEVNRLEQERRVREMIRRNKEQQRIEQEQRLKEEEVLFEKSLNVLNNLGYLNNDLNKALLRAKGNNVFEVVKAINAM
ncbi:actin cytoskeleton-regulatory complex protein pan1 [Acrasis kona]|uniref:Actin cytoskeleton-regulatory complex protein pan1 n=1 Tax=Acrasis kona TaxID=1008807 RepID=A0AAW2ZKA1_9EUKA